MIAGAIIENSVPAEAVSLLEPNSTADRRSSPATPPVRFLGQGLSRLLMPLGVLLTFLVLCVGLEVLERRVFSRLPIGWHHGLLTAWAGLLTAVACTIVYLPMRRQQRRLSHSAEQLAHLVDQYQRLRAQMVEKEKMAAIGQIAAGIAHEVGNPLSSISSVVQMLKRGRSNAPMTEELDLIETHIQRISAIVRQLVNMARPTVERWELIDVGDILEEAVRLISFDRRARRMHIDFERPRSLGRSYGLRGALQQVFINLSLNALDAMAEGGKLTIRAEGTRGSNVVRFQDTGRGISAEIGRRVFEPFFTTKEPGEGTGLGLSVSYGIVQKHGGTIDFESTAGEGTVFTVTLPLWDQPPEKSHGTNHHPTGGR